MENALIGFIGGGNMANSLINGLVDSDFDPAHIWVVDRNPNKLEQLAARFNVKTSTSAREVVQKTNVVVLGVKPQDMEALCIDIREILSERQTLIVTLAAGLQTRHYEHWFQAHLPIVRAMPNTPALLRCGATGLYSNARVNEEQKNLAESLLRTVGITVWVDHEQEIDSITALSGSGPAYFFLMMEALQQGAQKLGLSEKVAKILTLQTALGAARMALESELSLEKLRMKVASKGGTTEKALGVLENGGLRELMSKALKAAKDRAVEISHHFDKDKSP